VKEKITQVAVPAVTGAVGIAGGVLLSRTALQRQKKVFGIPVPGVKINLADISQNVSEAGKQFGRLASEISTARQKAEKISKALGGD
jgi:hypothetical protein